MTENTTQLVSFIAFTQVYMNWDHVSRFDDPRRVRLSWPKTCHDDPDVRRRPLLCCHDLRFLHWCCFCLHLGLSLSAKVKAYMYIFAKFSQSLQILSVPCSHGHFFFFCHFCSLCMPNVYVSMVFIIPSASYLTFVMKEFACKCIFSHIF